MEIAGYIPIQRPKQRKREDVERNQTQNPNLLQFLSIALRLL